MKKKDKEFIDSYANRNEKNQLAFDSSKKLFTFSVTVLCNAYRVHVYHVERPNWIPYVHDEPSFEPQAALYRLHRNTLAPPHRRIFQSSLHSQAHAIEKTQKKAKITSVLSTCFFVFKVYFKKIQTNYHYIVKDQVFRATR